MLTVAHVTHEAVRKIGGIGTVLEGIVNATPYCESVGRTFLIGPLFERSGPADKRIGDGGQVIYSSLDGYDPEGFGAKFEPIAREHGAEIIYGKKTLVDIWTERSSEVEVLLFDVSRANGKPLEKFKFLLYEKFGLDSKKYESTWDYEQYVRLACPAYETLRSLTGDEDELVVVGHEYMGVPSALRAVLADDPRSTAVFHAHETATARRIVEESPGHDSMFYNALEAAHDEGLLMRDLFGDHSNFYRHAVVKTASECDDIFAVGEYVRKELKFISGAFESKDIDVVPNGIPVDDTDESERKRSRDMLLDYAENLIGWRPKYIFAHVARLVISKGFWRDFHVLNHLDEHLCKAGECAVFYLLSTEGAQRTPEEVRRMERDYGWPWTHKTGYPDLVGSEIGLDAYVQEFNRRSRAVKAVFVNQFGWTRKMCGEKMPEEMTFVDLRRGADLEFGMSVYEPFGISQLEALTYGAICAPTNICGCVPFALNQAGGEPPKNIIVADYVSSAPEFFKAQSARDWVDFRRAEADKVLEKESRSLAERLLPALREQREREEDFIRSGRDLAGRMCWDVVAADFFLPGIRRALENAANRPPTGGYK